MDRCETVRRRATIFCLCLLAIPLASCQSVLWKPVLSQDPVAFVQASSAKTLVDHLVRPATTVAGKRDLTLEDCRRLALANNLDLQVARLEELTKEAIYYSNRTKMLPHFIFSGDLSNRNNLRYSYSDVLGQEGNPPADPLATTSGTGVTSYSTGHERGTWTYVLETRWSLTDAALAYYVMMSSSNDHLKSRYHRRRVIQKMVEVVDGAYFRLLGLQECLTLAQRLAGVRARIRERTLVLLEQQLAKTEELLKADQKAIRANQLGGKTRNDLEVQRNTLASAMALSPDYCVDGGFYVVGRLVPPSAYPEMCEIEMTAVQRRPEAYEAGLIHLNSVNDLKRVIVKYFPRISGFWRNSRDKDKFLYDKDWKEVGVNVYFDIADWIGNWHESHAARYNAAKTEREMGAIALGLTSQARLAALKYFASLDELRSARDTVQSSQRMVQALEARYSHDDVGKLAVDEARGDVLEAQIGALRAMGEANAAFAELQSAMGTNYQE